MTRRALPPAETAIVEVLELLRCPRCRGPVEAPGDAAQRLTSDPFAQALLQNLWWCDECDRVWSTRECEEPGHRDRLPRPPKRPKKRAPSLPADAPCPSAAPGRAIAPADARASTGRPGKADGPRAINGPRRPSDADRAPANPAHPSPPQPSPPAPRDPSGGPRLRRPSKKTTSGRESGPRGSGLVSTNNNCAAVPRGRGR